jgi:hypothetical protein
MKAFKSIFLISLAITVVLTSAGQSSSEKLDTTISIFWNPNLKVRIQILNPEEEDIKKKNSVLTLFSLDNGSKLILLRDSIFAYTFLIKMTDLDGDGIKDLLIYNANNGSENLSYHLYLVDQKLGSLRKVRGFDKIFNPYYDQRKCLVYGYESFERKLVLYRYIVNKNGTLAMVSW